MQNADSPKQGEGQGTAPGQEPFIPKHRFDEVLARLREVEQREQVKDQMYREHLQRSQVQKPQEQEPTLTPEDTGLDPQTHKAALKIAEAVANQKVERFRKEASMHLGQMANELELNKFLVQYDSDKGKYVDQIRDQQRKHQQMTGSYMDVETAYKLVKFDELEARSKRGDATPPPSAQAGQAAPSEDPQVNAPNAAATRVQPPAPGSAANKSFSELSLEDQEARLEEAFGQGGSI